ncbi:MAG: FAD-dependent oxidoreductase [Candidatus Hodarchaeales archaeon]
MKRTVDNLKNKVHDLLIIGGGIYGVTAAWDASLRGLSVALIEKDDFCSGNSANTMKIIHGGLRYLQYADFKRMRRSIGERTNLMKIAPHLVHPLPYIMPIYGHGTRGREAMKFALLANDLVSFDRNNLNDPQKHLPRGEVISKKKCITAIPSILKKNLTGGAKWYDGQVYNSERLCLSFLISGVSKGAEVANYIEVTGFIIENKRIIGVKAKDLLTTEELEIRARMVLNTSGPWVGNVINKLDAKENHKIKFCSAINIIVKQQILSQHALGIPCEYEYEDEGVVKKSKYTLIIAPWKKVTLIGTKFKPLEGDPDDFRLTKELVQEFIDEVNRAYPAANISLEDISFFHYGFLPIDKIAKKSKTPGVVLSKKYRIIDHQREDGIDGLISIVGLKYTTARAVAEKTIDLICKRLDHTQKSKSSEIPIYGGKIDRFNNFLSNEIKKKARGLNHNVIRNLIYNYGSEYPNILKYVDENPEWGETISEKSDVLIVEIIHAIRYEMAQRLSDVVLRRTDLGSSGNPGVEIIKKVADLMADELDWDAEKKEIEIEDILAIYTPFKG